MKRINERLHGQLLNFAEKVGGAKHDRGFQGRYRAKDHDDAVRGVYVGTAGELTVVDTTGGEMNTRIYATKGDKQAGRLGDVLTPEGLWIEVRAREYPRGVFGFQGDNPHAAKWDAGALVQVVEWRPGPREGVRGLPIALELVGFASLERIHKQMYLKQFPQGRHYVVDPDKFQPWEAVRDFLLEQRSGSRR